MSLQSWLQNSWLVQHATTAEEIANLLALSDRDRKLKAGCDAAEADWYSADHLLPLAFDHATILISALERLGNKLEYTAVGFRLLPEKFTLTELQEIYKAGTNAASQVKRNRP